VLDLAHAAASLGNVNAISDAASAGFLAQAALRCALANVRININSLQDPSSMQAELTAAEGMEAQAAEKLAAITGVLQERGGL
jgi:glutamate formiminotransferase/formiminotetrahydrofolate cyclodeaminase